MHMNAMTNSALVWKRKADESEQSVKTLTRISLILLVLLSLSGGYAYSAHNKVSELCASLERQTAADEAARKFGLQTLRAYCS